MNDKANAAKSALPITDTNQYDKKSNETKNLATYVEELRKEFKAAAELFKAATSLFKDEAEAAYHENEENFPQYTSTNRGRYWFMPFPVRSTYNSLTFPKPFDASHWWNSVKVGSNLYNKVHRAWERFHDMDVVKRRLDKAKQAVKQHSTLESVKAAVSKILPARLSLKDASMVNKLVKDVVAKKIVIPGTRPRKNYKVRLQRSFGIMAAWLKKTNNSGLALTINKLLERYKVSSKLSRPTKLLDGWTRFKSPFQAKRKFKWWPRLINVLARINKGSKRDRSKASYLAPQKPMMWQNFWYNPRRFNRVQYRLFAGNLKKRWRKPKVFRLIRRDFAHSAFPVYPAKVQHIKLLSLVSVPAVSSILPFSKRNVLMAKLLISGFNEMPVAHDKLEQFSVDLRQRLLDNLVSVRPLAAVRHVDKKLSAKQDQLVKAGRTSLSAYSTLLGKFYKDELKSKVSKTLPARRVIKDVVDFVKQTGTRKGNRLVRDWNTTALREIVKWKRPGLFFRERKKLFKLQILLNRLFSDLYKLQDVRTWMHKLHQMDMKNYLVRNFLVHRKNLKVSINCNKLNTSQRSTLLLRRVS